MHKLLNGFRRSTGRWNRKWTNACSASGRRPRPVILAGVELRLCSQATGMSRTTVTAGLRELDLPEEERVKEASRIRRPGGGRKLVTEIDPGMLAALEALIQPTTRGDPESPLRWTCKSTEKLAGELTRQDHPIGSRTVARLLREVGYSLQGNRKTREGSSHPDRNAQFEFINASVQRFIKRGQPAVSVDAKKKEKVGDFKNGGQEWFPKGEPEDVRVYDFLIKSLGKATPYGVYDLLQNEGWVSVGIDHDTAQFAVNSIRRWWNEMGEQRFPHARELLITADGGGSNSSRSRLWKVSLQDLADELGIRLFVCHFPPGTSKWNKIEHRLFSFITKNWCARPLVNLEVIVNLIASTTTRTGLIVKAALDTNRYPDKIKVTDEQLGQIRVKPNEFHGDWNYTLLPRR